MIPLSAGEMCAGRAGSLPDLTILMSSGWVCALENGELALIEYGIFRD